MANKYTLPDLTYDLGDLEPVISAEIMDLHYHKHHQGYITNLNNLLEKQEDALNNNDIAKAIALQSGINFNGGGYINHSIFWTNLAPKSKGGGIPPEGALANSINSCFGSLDHLIQRMSAKTTAIQGSGWGWLGYNKENQRLEIATCRNQDPLATKGLVPLLGIDVWEHAYYLQYKNVRPDYVKAIWEIVNWKNVSERFAAAQA